MKKIGKMTCKLSLALTMVLGFLSVSNNASSIAEAKESTIPIQLLGINDLHGNLDTVSKDINGNPIGGMDYMAANFDRAESEFLSENPKATTNNSIRVQAGDMVGASPAISGLLQDEPTMKVLKLMKFEVGTLGNHEFDEGLPEFKRILLGKKPDPRHQFQTNDGTDIVSTYPQVKSRMDIVAANVIDKRTGQIPEGFKPYVIKTVKSGGHKVKIGFIGLLTTKATTVILHSQIENIDFLDEADTIVKYAKELREKGVHSIVVLDHTGVSTPGSPAGPEASGGSISGDAVDVMNKVYKEDPNNSVDLVLAGHSHQFGNGTVESTRIVQALSFGKAFDDIRGEINPKTGDFVQAPAAIVRYNERNNVTPVKKITHVITDAKKRVAPIVNSVIGYAKEPVYPRYTDGDKLETALGDLIVDGQLFEANKEGKNVDFAMTNNGGIRSDLISNPTTDGKNEITWGSAQAVQPFGNFLQIVEMKGSDILEALNQQYDNEYYYLQVAGLKYQYAPSPNDSTYHYKVASITTDSGQPFDLNKTYRVIINDFLYGGGDGFSAFKKGNMIDTLNGLDTDVFVQYIKDQNAEGKVIDPQTNNRRELVDSQTYLGQ
ncbi:bifunctional metallophosphatase/5'-nucleotidase [Terrilactibacillus laevilacticus]|uniref:Bifunctional metallophosphatase/5'-nucleotidase n=1 Tax=Terrilactibacillus laevilacticus TaxID=1380157 RepID=A0ABW5PM65_9BACI|nr:bifunctional metallophosphatase/5'-nucleotidase [Terrilactibacillus laevilacticus]